MKYDILKVIESEDWQLYNKERDKFIQPWQYIEAIDLEPEGRYELDIEVYKQDFVANSAFGRLEYKETDLLRILINSMQEANLKHPVWVKYLEFLIKKTRNKSGRKETTRKKFRMYLKESARLKYDKNKEAFKDEFQNMRGKEVALLYRVLKEYYFDKKEDNLTAFLESLKDELGKLTGYRNISNYIKEISNEGIPEMSLKVKKYLG